MKKLHNSSSFHIALLSGRAMAVLITAIIILVLSIILFIHRHSTDNYLAFGSDRKIELSPSQISEIKQIGEWEFLSISDEELLDTIRHGFFGDDELTRIYYGTLHLGINMGQLDEHWLTTKGDTLYCTFPPIQLLDEDFIDEARTKSFIEKGTWDESVRKQLYQRAAQLMKQRTMTPANIKLATQNATTQITLFMKSMGYPKVKVQFSKK